MRGGKRVGEGGERVGEGEAFKHGSLRSEIVNFRSPGTMFAYI